MFTNKKTTSKKGWTSTYPMGRYVLLSGCLTKLFHFLLGAFLHSAFSLLLKTVAQTFFVDVNDDGTYLISNAKYLVRNFSDSFKLLYIYGGIVSLNEQEISEIVNILAAADQLHLQRN
ncbi:hypothetical protein GLOIN_2v1712047 [Rhizophagus clarus]|uniref:BTB domain-containing protein n=1 Tax=Rhizophagus clarus TaxID=94130 RepID=A0A8H3LNJ5_9GLOM|nr:hypothetical protein GLOIN_2v1712047 [Rhizophagus clarus]